MSSPAGNYKAVALSAIGRHWEPRSQYVGTYDKHWEEEVFPSLPEDFDEQHYQCAPEDQQIAYPKRRISMEISSEQYENSISGFLMIDCEVRSADIFYFSLSEDETQLAQWDEDDEDSWLRRRIVYFIRSLAPAERWGNIEFDHSYDFQLFRWRQLDTGGFPERDITLLGMLRRRWKRLHQRVWRHHIQRAGTNVAPAVRRTVNDPLQGHGLVRQPGLVYQRIWLVEYTR
ncbi:DUF2169 domain-containing protein [Massilia sp. CCM 8694]|uniref:DUF2169 domain-containing protein n=1 Tax=Massilia genomosp. 1 TaxID=2609280 RepID=A0ABX0MY79_9BURK|nr:DUF2169 domain-containing protein [Massilia genomosp. 1]